MATNNETNVVANFSLPRTLKAKMDAHTKETGVPMAFIVRKVLTEYFDRETGTGSPTAIDCKDEV